MVTSAGQTLEQTTFNYITHSPPVSWVRSPALSASLKGAADGETIVNLIYVDSCPLRRKVEPSFSLLIRPIG